MSSTVSFKSVKLTKKWLFYNRSYLKIAISEARQTINMPR